MTQIAPKARADGLIVMTMPDETMVYDTRRNEARVLNKTAGLIWKQCDGTRSVAQIKQQLDTELGVALPEDVVWHGLRQLDEYALLQEPLPAVLTSSTLSRRKLLKLGIAISLLPLVTSVLAPTPAQAQSPIGATDPIGVTD